MIRKFTKNRLKYSTKLFVQNYKMSTQINNLKEILLDLPQGCVKGVQRRTIYDDEYYSFEGIPYGRPPVGELRFKAPKPAGNWPGILDCTSFDKKPMQMTREGTIDGTEDCLYLNVYTKTLKYDANLPVMAWIYGGGFGTGNCTRNKFGPDYFMRKDVILVTFNYRVSALGFLCLHDPELEVPGNAGLKDQILAIQWVKANICHFGGNCNNITLFGESAGAASVHYVLCAERARGLVQKAICMSGCILNQWAFSDQVYAISLKLAHLRGYKGPNNDKDVLTFLQSLPAEQLMDVEVFNAQAQMQGNIYAFVPVMEPYKSAEAVITENRLHYLKNAWGNSIPLMLGGTSFEGLVLYPRLKKSPQLLTHFVQNPTNYFPKDIPVAKDSEEFNARVDAVLQAFFNSTQIASKDILNYLDFFSYCYFWHSFHRLVRARQCYASAPTYQYRFDFDSPTFNHHRRMFCGTDITEGVAHADDVDYLFYSQHSWPLEPSSPEYEAIQRMVDIWYNFASTSNASLLGSEAGADAWPDVKHSDEFSWLNISTLVEFKRMPLEIERKLLAFNKLYGKHLIDQH